MKLLFLVDGNVFCTGGAELQAFNLANQLDSMGHEIDVVGPYLDRNTQQITERLGIAVRQLNYWKIPKLSSIFYMIRFAWFLRQEAHQYDAIHIHTVHKMAAVTGLLRHYAPCPVVAKVSGAYEHYQGEQSPSSHLGSLQHWVNKAIAKLDFFQAISEDTCQRLALSGIASDKILAIPNGVDTKTFLPSKALHTDNNTKTVICFCGRLVGVKGLETLIDAAALLQQQLPDQFEVHLNGDGERREALQQQVQSLGLESVVLFKGNTDNVAQALQQAHIYAQTSLYEGLSNAVLEAMSSGLPLVLTAAGGNKDVVKQEHNGYLVSPSDATELASQLAKLISDRALCRQMGQNSRDWAEREYSLISVANRLLALYGNNAHKANASEQVQYDC